MTEHRILLADADAFFVAVARLVDPEGAGKEPLLVVGGSAQGRGVVTSASYETRAFGVRSGMPMARALRLCPNAVRVSVPGAACRDKSRAIRRILERFTPVVEAASVDEWYLDLTGTEQLYHHEPLAATAARIRGTVLDETAVAVSIGGGSSKLVAKLAAKRAKPHDPRSAGGVWVVAPGDESAFLTEHQLTDIPGVGPKLGERLAVHGLHSVLDALDYDEATLSGLFGERTGQWLYRRIRGISTSAVTRYRDPKSMSRERTFATDITGAEDLERELLRLATHVARDLRSTGLKARTVTVKYREPDFTTSQASRTLPHAVDADQPILSTAQTLLRRLHRERPTGARLLGVALSHFEHPEGAGTPTQLSLFGQAQPETLETEQDRLLARTLDDVNRRFGGGRLVRGTEVRKPPRRP